MQNLLFFRSGKMLACIIWLFLTIAIVGSAKDVKVRTAWQRTFPGTSLTIMPDHLGNILAVGTESDSAVALLLNKRGKIVAKQPIPIPSVTGVIADTSGRVFVMGDAWPTSVRCMSFAPLLSEILWIEEKNLTNAWSPPWANAWSVSLLPDEAGGAFVFGHWYNGVFANQFTGAQPGFLFYKAGFAKPSRSALTAARSPSGDVFFVCRSLLAGTLPYPTVYKYSPSNPAIIAFGDPEPSSGIFYPLAATCDSSGNLILVGWKMNGNDSRVRRGRCHVMKMDSQLNILWEASHGPLDGGRLSWNFARAVAVDKNDNIIMTGDSGTVKYSPAGEVLWEALIKQTTLNLDQFGNVLFFQAVARDDGTTEPEITKLNADGTLRWQVRYQDERSSSSGPTGLVTDDEGDVYLAVQSAEGSTVVKFVERGNDKKE